MITKKITNTTFKIFKLGWNFNIDGHHSTKSILIPAKALNYKVEFADEDDYKECVRQNQIYFAKGNLIEGQTKEQSAVKKNEANAKKDLETSTEKIDQEIEAIKENSQKTTKKSAVEVTVDTAG